MSASAPQLHAQAEHFGRRDQRLLRRLKQHLGRHLSDQHKWQRRHRDDHPYSRLEVWGRTPPRPAPSPSSIAPRRPSSRSTTPATPRSPAASSKTPTSGSRPTSRPRRLKLARRDRRAQPRHLQLDRSRAKSSVPQFGFIAQQVQPVFPNLVSTTSPTALTPDGTLSLNYIDLISPIVAAIQELDQEITSLASTVAGFAQSITISCRQFRSGQHATTLRRMDVRHARPIPGDGRRRQSVRQRRRFLIAFGNGRDRHAARHSDQRRQPRHHPSRRELHRSRRDDHRPASRPQSRHHDIRQRRACQQHRDRHERRRHRHDRLRRHRRQGLTSTSTRTVIVQPAASSPPIPDPTASTTEEIQRYQHP